MASFDLHDKCARCREKSIGEDDCVKNKSCAICDGFLDSQREMLATPTYRIRKDKKAGLLVSPKDVKVISAVDSEPIFQSPSGASLQAPVQPPPVVPASSSTATQPSYVTSEQFAAISDKWAEQLARMEALMSRGNIFSAPVTSVKPVDSQTLISQTPFIPPATRPTGPVEVPVAVEVATKSKPHDDKERKKNHKSKKHDKPADHKSSHKSDAKVDRKRDRSPSPVRKHSSSKSSHVSKTVPSSGPESAKQSITTTDTSAPVSSAVGAVPTSTGMPSTSSVPAGPEPSRGACAFPPDPGFEHFNLVSDEEEDNDRSGESSLSDEGQLSDSTETPEQTEEMSYRETVRSVRSYMG